MDSYYETIAVLDEPHKVYLVQHRESKKIYVKKILDIYNLQIYQYLKNHYIAGIPRIIDFCEYDSQLVVIEEYISGISLQEKIDTADLSMESIKHYIADICTILEQLHSAQPPIVHRDIKPSNIIITNCEGVVLLDFNAAKYYTENSDSDTILLGTKGYAAPEQYGFGSSSSLTDIYAIGVLLKELLSGFPEIPRQFSKVIDKCTEMNPSDRFQTVAELRDALLQTKGAGKSRKITYAKKLSYVPPGFRTRTPWKMLVASMVYFFVFWLFFTMQIKNTTIITLWLERIFVLLIMLSVIFGTCDYLNFQSLIPLCRHKNIVVRVVGIILLDIILVFSLVLILAFLELAFFS